MANKNGSASTESLDQQFYSSSDHPSQDGYFIDEYQFLLNERIQRWLATSEWNPSCPECQVEEIETTNGTQVPKITQNDQHQSELNINNSPRYVDSDNSMFYAFTTGNGTGNSTFSLNSTESPDQQLIQSTSYSDETTESDTTTFYSCSSLPYNQIPWGNVQGN